MSKRILALFLVLAVPTLVAAQEVPSWAAPTETLAEPAVPISDAALLPPNPPPPPPPVPLDGGLTLLALAGAGYAAKRLRANRS